MIILFFITLIYFITFHISFIFIFAEKFDYEIWKEFSEVVPWLDSFDSPCLSIVNISLLVKWVYREQYHPSLITLLSAWTEQCTERQFRSWTQILVRWDRESVAHFFFFKKKLLYEVGYNTFSAASLFLPLYHHVGWNFSFVALGNR